MHLRSLKIFCDTVRLRSFSKAAEENGVSQSSASQVVHQLEERLGVQMIDRSKRPFVLTPEGEHFYDGCRAIVRRYADLVREVTSLHEAVSARLRVASIYSIGLAHMSQYLREFLEANPRADVRMEYLHPDRVYESVESDEADLGLVSYPEPTRMIDTTAWRDEPMVLVCRPDHPLAALPAISLEMLDGKSLVAFQSGLRIREEIDHALDEAGAQVRVALEFDNIETIKRAVEAGDGVALLPEPTVGREVATGDLTKLPLTDGALVRPLGFIHRRDRPLSDTARRLIQLLQSHAADPLADCDRAASGRFSAADLKH
ncbi:HTH-type transcriptional regulator CysL [Pirellulimonas nuda]|uniref:HTH-type transcriptional regulator CysL n=1 Tax=Pirellulimonas nuda TaxID=2528009 RepID=A0A518D5I7_9BACT|nr:LysR family transcriptional regulator [Pirellulimonas nuda]QDU86730.1 HTH-type transcriptional regulator CysL [Pirellulimonas nuda]